MKNVLKPLIASSLCLAALLAGGAAFGQETARHDVTINIPEVVEIRIIDDTGTDAVANPFVAFDYDNAGDYFAAVEAGELVPTDTNFDDIVVFVNRYNSWTVSVQASPLLDGTGSAPLGLSLGDITVTPSNTDLSPYSLSTTDTDIASGTKTSGFQSLGIAGSDYRVAVDGDEAPGDYTTTVTYTLTAP